jgi:hypothetical protein
MDEALRQEIVTRLAAAPPAASPVTDRGESFEPESLARQIDFELCLTASSPQNKSLSFV